MRSTISSRLVVPFALFLAPIAFLLYFLIQTHQRTISTAENEISGIAPVAAALDLSQRLIDMAADNSKRPELARAVDALKEAHSRFLQDVPLAEQITKLEIHLYSLSNMSRVSIVDIAHAIDLLGRIIRMIGDSSELILDPDLDTYYYMEMLVVLSPELLAKKRDMLQHILIAQAGIDDMSPEARRSYYYMREIESLIGRLENAKSKTRLHRRPVATENASEDSGARYINALDDLREGWAAGAAPAKMQGKLEATLALGSEWRASVAAELGFFLNMRINEVASRRNEQVLLSIAMFLFAAVFMAVLVRSYVTKPVKRLTASMIDLADGNLSVPLPSDVGCGEVGDMIRAVGVFKESAIRNQILEQEKRQAASALSATATTLQRAETIAGLGHWRWQAASNEVTWSPNLFYISGFHTRSTLPQLKHMLARVPRSERLAVLQYIKDIFRDLQPLEMSFTVEHPEFGMRRLLSLVAIEQKPSGELTAVLGIVQDVTDSHQSQMKLEARSAALAEAQAIGRIGDWSFALGDSHVRWSQEIYALLRYDPHTFETTRQAILEIYEGDGAQRVLQSQADVMRTGETRAVDVRAFLGDGSVADFTVVSKADYSESGQICGFSGTIQDVSERKTAERELEKLAYYDPLTGLANRALFRRSLRNTLNQTLSSQATAALMLLDLDRFKEVNDSLGHAAGDELLVLVASQLRRVLPADAFLARLGGDEFAVILHDVDPEQALQFGRGITNTLAEPMQLKLGEVQIGTSIGIAMIPRDGAREEDLIRNADLALYNAKDDGRSCVRFFTPTLSDAVQEKSMIARDLRRALGVDDQLFVVYQPQVDIQKGCVTGFEALLRWRHPERGLIAPSIFVPIAESSSLIGDLGLYVLRASCFQMKAWIDAGEKPRDVAVNVSATQIWQSDFESDVKQILMETELPPALLTLEVTESVFLREAEGRVRQSLESLKALGVKLALDDFGTGYSSLGYLNRLPFDKLKIDRRFVAGVNRNSERLNLLKGIIELGAGLGMTVVAEGAEQMEEVRALRSLNCQLVQGYVFSHPLEGPSAVRAAAMLDLMVPSAQPGTLARKAA